MTAADDEAKNSGVPSWQLKSTSPSSDTESQTPAPETSPTRAQIVENAQKFLLEDLVKDASTEKKIAFLEGKGLDRREIQELLGISRNVESSSLPLPNPAEEITPASYTEPTTHSVSSQPQRKADIPPIITYPEFLTTPTQPAPLVTAQRLLNTLYIFGGLSTLLYGTHKYLVVPMAESLTSSRHELISSAQTHLNKLNGQLEGVVSKIPENPQSLTTHRAEDEDSDSDSDPTELFHRDIGVQTSLPATPSASRPHSPHPAPSILSEHVTKLNSVTSHIKNLNGVSTIEDDGVTELSATINTLREYLNTLAYVPPSYSYSNPYSSGRASETANDEISKLKAQIRGVKGVLLAARTFPGSVSSVR